jgi:S-adenosylmethionine:tRNA ribosyltransferase-isomerase
MPDLTALSSYDYFLPPELIAQVPAAARDDARLMVIARENQLIEHRQFREITDYLPAGSVLVLNDTKVLPARLYGKKSTGGSLDVLLLQPLTPNSWEAIIRGRIKAGANFVLEDKLTGVVLGPRSQGRWEIRFDYPGDLHQLLAQIGHPPLPPYIKRLPGQDDSLDKERYQTVYAVAEGAVAAPTAGLHFTRDLLRKLTRQGVKIVYLTLHVGPGTFLPVRKKNILRHAMESESYHIPKETADAINYALEEGRRIMVVGTSALRAEKLRLCKVIPNCSFTPAIPSVPVICCLPISTCPALPIYYW